VTEPSVPRAINWLTRSWKREVIEVRIGEAVDTFGGATGEEKARAYEVEGLRLPGHEARLTR
jgi:hypothetical protein